MLPRFHRQISLFTLPILSRRIRLFKHIKYFQRNFNNWSTIYSLSTAIPDRGCPIAVVRMSGRGSREALAKLTGKKCSRIFKNARQAINCTLYEPKTGEIIDRALVIWFPEPRSYTGQDMVEFHIHGSRPVAVNLLNSLSQIDDCQPAKEGDFTRRAFVNGKMSLTEAEAISQLIESRTEKQRKYALRSVSGDSDKIYDKWRSMLSNSVASLEATIDFGEGELIPDSITVEMKEELTRLRDEIDKYLLEAKKCSELIREGINMAIIGQPNAGKSTFFNKLCRRELSIVSPISGTTRDIIEGILDINGWAVKVCDTAGLKTKDQLSDVIEEEGIRRALARAKQANLVILMVDVTSLGISQTLTKIHEITNELDPETLMIRVFNKVDLLSEEKLAELKRQFHHSDVCWISCKDDQQIDNLMNEISVKIEQLASESMTSDFFANERHQIHLRKMSEFISEALENLDYDLCIAGHYVREAIQQIGCITGRITNEEILDIIFSKFCIGK